MRCAHSYCWRRTERLAKFDIVADCDGARGPFEYDIYECDSAPVARRRLEFALAKKGERKRFEISLAQAALGWYGLDYFKAIMKTVNDKDL